MRLQLRAPSQDTQRPDALRILAKWNATAEEGKSPKHNVGDYNQFWAYWGPREVISLEFADLFDKSKMQATLDQIAKATGTDPVFRGPPARALHQIMFNKALTRLVGNHAPRIDTTIHTLKG